MAGVEGTISMYLVGQFLVRATLEPLQIVDCRNGQVFDWISVAAVRVGDLFLSKKPIYAPISEALMQLFGALVQEHSSDLRGNLQQQRVQVSNNKISTHLDAKHAPISYRHKEYRRSQQWQQICRGAAAHLHNEVPWQKSGALQ